VAKNQEIKVLFVCMGNICRSPTAEGVFRHIIQNKGFDWIKTDSAGTHAYHIGEPPDSRSQQTALSRGINLSDLRARKAVSQDFDSFDYVIAMDNDNYRNLESICPNKHINKLHLFLDFSKEYNESEVPDPYYGGAKGFEHVFDLVESASYGLITDIQNKTKS